MMRRGGWVLLIAVFAGCMEPAPTPAAIEAPAEDGIVRIEGVVLQGPNDSPAADAALRLYRPDRKFYPMVSDAHGKFAIDIPAFPSCDIEVKKAGFQTTRFVIDCTVDANVVLRISPETSTTSPTSRPAQTSPPSPSPSPSPSPPKPSPSPSSPSASPSATPEPIVQGVVEYVGGPHVIVGVPDTGINPYHRLYYRPHLAFHPCTYIADFPCEFEALPLSVGMDNWQEAYDRDRDVWARVVPGKWYWIPQTVFVAVSCENPPDGMCILDDTNMHGTGTTSSVIMENPNAYLAFREGGGDVVPFKNAKIPVDIFSVSWGYTVPIPLLEGWSVQPIYVKSAGNDPRSTIIDGWSGDPDVISVGGAYASTRSEEILAAKQPEIVSYYCRPTAQTKQTTAMRPSYCGTSFAGPTAAGALSKVILAVRKESGYSGSVHKGVVDPAFPLTIGGLRDALNRTATYSPTPKYPNQSITGVPLLTQMPCLQWGWGFYDGNVADATIKHLLGETAPRKSAECETYMMAQHTAKKTLNGPL